jgi:hypothetical protein
MRTAPKDGEKMILVTTPRGDGSLAVIPAIWGQPLGFNEPDWWGVSFGLALPSGNKFSDLPELRSSLIAITPKHWKPWPKDKRNG